MPSWVHDERERFSPLGIRQSLRRALEVFLRAVSVFWWIGLMVMGAPMTILSLYGYKLWDVLLHSRSQNFPFPYWAPDDDNLLTRFVVGSFAVAICFALPTLMTGTAAVIHATVEIYAARTPEWVDCLEEGSKDARRLFLLCLVAVFGVSAAGMLYFLFVAFAVNEILCLVIGDNELLWKFIGYVERGGLYFIFVYSLGSFLLAPSAMVVERKSPYDALKRSWDLMDQRRLLIFCALFSLTLVNGLVTAVLTLVLGTGACIVLVPFGALMMPLGHILRTVLFLSVRVEKEGLNEEVLLRELDRGVAERPGSGSYEPVNIEPVNIQVEPFVTAPSEQEIV